MSQARLAIAGSIPIAPLVSQGFTDVDVMGDTEEGDGKFRMFQRFQMFRRLF